jgi:hypothetical protein
LGKWILEKIRNFKDLKIWQKSMELTSRLSLFLAIHYSLNLYKGVIYGAFRNTDI